MAEMKRMLCIMGGLLWLAGCSSDPDTDDVLDVDAGDVGAAGNGDNGEAGIGGNGVAPDAGEAGSGGTGDDPDAGEAGSGGDGDAGTAEPDAGYDPDLKENTEACDDGSECQSGNCVSGACCAEACDNPGECQQLEGTICLNGDTCRYGQLPDDTDCDDDNLCTTSVCFDGECLVEEETDCSDGDACTDNTCDPATGDCVDEAVDCDDNNPCTNFSCDSSQGCGYTSNDDGECDDGDPCTVSACSGGTCSHTPVDCSGLSSECAVGICIDGDCDVDPINEGESCSEGMDACQAGVCDDGACVDSGNPCGDLATGCQTCSDGEDCFEGRLCECEDDGPIVDGACVPETHACLVEPAPCDPAAECYDPDPSSPTSEAECSCPAGYEGDGYADGTGCTVVDFCEALEDPCDNGTCNNVEGGYECLCDPGFRSIDTGSGPTCTCDLAGSHVLVATNTVEWSTVYFLGVPVIEGSPEGGVQTRSWALRHNTVDEDGTLTSYVVPCGATTPDLCITSSIVGERTIAQYQANQDWGAPFINDGFNVVPIESSLEGVVPGGSYSETETVSLMGIRLDDPTGEWPPCRQCVGVSVGDTCTCDGGTHTVTNAAEWVLIENQDDELDGQLGVATYAVAPGGQLLDGEYPDPPYDYTEPTECPRMADGSYGYDWWRGTVGWSTFNAGKWRSATRVISSFEASEVTYDATAEHCVVQGAFTGPDDGLPRTEARMRSCVTCPSDCGDRDCTLDDCTEPCNSDQTDFFDEADEDVAVTDSVVVLEPWTGDIGPVLEEEDDEIRWNLLNQACQEVREANCPDGLNCELP